MITDVTMGLTSHLTNAKIKVSSMCTRSTYTGLLQIVFYTYKKKFLKEGCYEAFDLAVHVSFICEFSHPRKSKR